MATPSRRWLKWVLVASLGLNLVALGLVGGALIKGPPPSGPMPGVALWRYGHALPRPYRDDLGRALRDSAGDWRGPREALRSRSGALADAIAAEPFDPAAVEAVLRSQADTMRELSARGTGLLMAQIVRMTPDERAAYAAALRADPGPRRDRRR